MPTVVQLEEQDQRTLQAMLAQYTTLIQLVQKISTTQDAQGLILIQIQNSVVDSSAVALAIEESSATGTVARVESTDEVLAHILKESNKENNNKMPKKKATIDFQLLDNGTATATITGAIDAAGNTVPLPPLTGVPSWASSNPAITVAAATDGMSAVLTPTALATGVVITATATEADGTTTLTGSGNPIDVVAGPAASLAIAEQ